MLRKLLSPLGSVERISHAANGVQVLDLSVRPARTEGDLLQAVALRQAAYGRRRPPAAAPRPDAEDYWPHAVVLMAIDKASARLLGTMRVVRGDAGPLELDRYVRIDRRRLGRPAEAARLAIAPDRRALVAKLALFKAFHRLCVGHGLDTMVAAARRPIDREYLWLDFEDLTGQPEWFVPGSAFPDPHRVLRLGLHGLEQRWKRDGHAFYRFNFATAHPDIRPFPEAGVNPLASVAEAG